MIAGLLAERDGSEPPRACWEDAVAHGDRLATGGGAAGGERPRFVVSGYRCPTCGYLELRAEAPL